ncbi:MAG: CU044_5270 family protein [Actinoallomurus sp.]
MDEMRMIKSFLDEAPPSGEVMEEGRRRLTGGVPHSRPRTRRRLWGGLTVLGAAAVALAVALMGGGVSPSRRPVEPVRTLTARQVLLTAADKAAAAPVGRYWHTHVISSEGYHIDHGDYMIFGARQEIDQWIARGDKDPDVFRSRFAGSTPQTAADHAAWQRAGSPASWRVLSNGDHIPQSAKSGAWDLRRASPADKREEKRFEAGMAKRCAAHPKACPPIPPGPKEREAMAHDPQALKRYLLGVAGMGGSSYLLTVAGGFLLDPSSPELRSAVFRVLADEPGVRSLGTARDPLGRPAIVLAGRTTQNKNVYDNELLLDPKTYVPLGVQTVLVHGNGGKRVAQPAGRPPIQSGGLETKGMKPGAVTHSEIYLAMGWTDTAYGG